MNFNLGVIILVGTGFLILNAYHDGKYLNMLKQYKKYYQMAFFAFLGLSAFLFLKNNPEQGHQLIKSAGNFVKYMPIDKQSADILTPMFKITNTPIFTNNPEYSPQYQRMINSRGKICKSTGTTKRSVSETKKKFIAAQQSWKCGDCNCQLPAWFEVDHKLSLERGGDNSINNLVALCRDCHGKKTALDSML